MIVALSGSSGIFELGTLKSILCRPSLPDEIVSVRGKIESSGPPARPSSSGIAFGPSISTQINPPSLDHWPVIRPTPVALPSSNSLLISSNDDGFEGQPGVYARLPRKGVSAQS